MQFNENLQLYIHMANKTLSRFLFYFWVLERLERSSLDVRVVTTFACLIFPRARMRLKIRNQKSEN